MVTALPGLTVNASDTCDSYKARGASCCTRALCEQQHECRACAALGSGLTSSIPAPSYTHGVLLTHSRLDCYFEHSYLTRYATVTDLLSMSTFYLLVELWNLRERACK